MTKVLKPGKNRGEGFPLLAYLDGLVEDLRTRVPQALNDFDADAVHKSRVATRRLKAGVDLLEPVLTDRHRKPFAKAGKKLRRRLGPLRDLDVMIDRLEDEVAKMPRHEAAANWVAGELRARRETARKASADDIPTARVLSRLGTWWGLREELDEAADAVPSLLVESLHLQLDRFVEQADWLTGQRVPAKSEASAKPPDPHALRIAGKALRYTLEMADAQGHKLPAGAPRTFKRMQELLGAWHDFVVLTERSLETSVEQLLCHHDPAMQRRVLELADFTLRKSERHLSRFGALWKKKGPDLSESIRVAFPLTKAVPAPVKDTAPDQAPMPTPARPEPAPAPTA